MKKSIKNLLTIVFAVAIFAVTASAAPKPNLSVRPWSGPSSVIVNSPYQYTARVKNIGNQTALNVKLTIEFPLTNTSPTVLILGKVTGLQTGCAISGNKLVCALGNLAQNQTRPVVFNFEFPVTTKPLVLTATATTDSTNEADPLNNVLAYSPTVTYQDLPVTAADVVVSHCTGTNLTSFFECEAFPSSISSFEMRLEQGGVISLQYPGYFGNWDQQTFKQLHFVISDGSDGVEFSGFTSKPNCFDGMATFTPQSTYNSAYRVCIQ